MKAYHGDQAIKDKYVARMEAHIARDELIRGTGWSEGKGCAVGCTLDRYDHEGYPVEIGFREWLARVEDTLFEGMSFEKSKTFPLLFLQAVTPGADLDKVKGPFLVYVLRRALNTFDNAAHPNVAAAVNGSIALWEREDIGSDNWYKAADAAADAAAWAAARAAVDAAVDAAADAARAAADAAAWAAARAAVDAARAARAAAYDEMADELLKLMAACGA